MTGKTAAEIIAERADATKPTMGLVTWKNAPHGKILKGDVSIAKRLAEEHYATFRIEQDRRFESDFEKEIKRIEGRRELGGGKE